MYLELNPVSAQFEGNWRQKSYITGSHCQGFVSQGEISTLRRFVSNDNDKLYPLIYSKFDFPYDGATAIIDIEGYLHFWVIGGRQKVTERRNKFPQNSSITLNISDWKHNITDDIYHDYWLVSPAFQLVPKDKQLFFPKLI